MKNRSSKIQSRRELLTGALRYSALGVSGMLGGWSFVKKRRLKRQGKCINAGICRGCRVYERCGLPAALSAKQVLSGRKRGGK
ncbi:MAG: hypothetical protein DRP65_09685 [Planctomycetota bacterium]|nr:MAG: hypothetical protein DRP65_09685 [Planctomycetota bacterium]